MDRHTTNYTSSTLGFYWTECAVLLNDSHRFTSFSASLIVLFTTNTFEMIIGFPLNIWLIYHILNKRSGILPADFFPFHLALIQVLFYLCLPMAYTNLLLWRSNAVLDLMSYMDSLLLVMKPLLLCLMCLERYIAVVRPLNYIRLKRPKYKWGCLAFIWIIYIFLATLSLHFVTRYTLCILFIPVLIIDTFCTGSILKSLQKPPPGDNNIKCKTKEVKEKRAPTMKGGEKEKRAEASKGASTWKKKAFVTVAVVQAMLMLNYTPSILILMLITVLPDHTVKCQLLGVAMSTVSCLSYMQPLLYLHRLGRLPCTQTHRSASRK